MGIGGERAMAESRSFAPVTPLRVAPIHPSDEDLSLGTPASCSAQDDNSTGVGLDCTAKAMPLQHSEKPSVGAEGFVICGSLGDAVDCYGFEDDGFVGLVLCAARDLGDFVGDVLAFDDFTKDGVIASQPGGWRNSDEELAAVGIGAGVGHGELAGLVESVRRAFGFVLEAIAGAAHAGAGGVASLDHEVGDDAMKDGSVEELAGRLGARG